MAGPRTAIIIAAPDDVHAQTVAWEIGRLGGRAIILDTAEFPAGWQLSMSPGAQDGSRFAVTTPDGVNPDADSLSGLWLRRRLRGCLLAVTWICDGTRHGERQQSRT